MVDNINYETQVGRPWGIFLDKMMVYKDKVKIVFKDGREVVKEV